MKTDDSTLLLHAASRVFSDVQPLDLVRYTSALADALGVTRQTVHAWRRRPDAPKRIGRFWSIREWRDYMKTHQLAANGTVDRATAISEICATVLDKIPPRLSRHRLQHVLAHVKTALHISLPGTRFRSDACDTREPRRDV